MALDAGNEECESGLSKRIYDAWRTDARAGFAADFPTNVNAQKAVKALCWAVAKSVVEEILANST